MDYSALSTPSVWRSARSAAPAAVNSIRFSRALPDDFEIPAFLRKQADESQPASLQAMVAAVFEHLSHGGSVQGFASHCDALELHTDARLALDQAVALGLSIGDAWLMLAHWVNRRPAGVADAAVTVALRPYLDGIDASLFALCMKLFDRTLGCYALDGWGLSRTERLRQALTQPLL
jgi:hypothetical protein